MNKVLIIDTIYAHISIVQLYIHVDIVEDTQTLRDSQKQSRSQLDVETIQSYEVQRSQPMEYDNRDDHSRYVITEPLGHNHIVYPPCSNTDVSEDSRDEVHRCIYSLVTAYSILYRAHAQCIIRIVVRSIVCSVSGVVHHVQCIRCSASYTSHRTHYIVHITSCVVCRHIVHHPSRN